MDWLEEKLEKLQSYIRNLSFRKAMIAYILALAVVVAGISYLTMIACWQWEMAEWIRYEQADFSELVYRKGLWWGFWHQFAEQTDSVKILLLDMIRVWCPFFYSFAGMIVTICIFYKKRLARPLSILADSVEKIRENDLAFRVDYESRDELGKLCDSVEDMRAELVHGKEEMWRLVERQKELNAAFAHDLRTPLTVLRGYTDFLARYIPEGKISEEKMYDTLALMSRHLRRLENYSRTMKGIQSIEEVPFSPEQMELRGIQKKIEEVTFALNQVGDIKIHYRKWEEDDTFQVEADDNIIMEVLENVLSNAIRYAGNEIEVWSWYDEKKMEFLLAVRDDGKGFSKEQLKKALQPYYKERKSMEMDEHFGIGLHICREFCKIHGGALNVANSIRGGAVVTASFSFAPAAPL
ncbi:MAG: HAMP domain-containing histidine kinase [Lachnospiraceae bacterium]|nr:HAMP domain-containing histidine kinase [Lachnospiraceae bacterium]